MKSLKSYMIVGVLFVSVLGTLLHFAYSWSGNNVFVGLFTPVNESIWEHTKLIFFPMLTYSFYLNKRLKDMYPCISSAMNFGALLGVLLIIVLFYSYSGVTGFNADFINIAIFYLSVIVSFYVAYKLTLSCSFEEYTVILQFLSILMICLFIIFTLFPPTIPLFTAP